MTSNVGLGQADWQLWQQQQYAEATRKMNRSRSYVGSNRQVQTGSVQKTSTNSCTDGKDDGKIGFFAAAGHAIKGAAKGLWNGIKGCFTNSEGKFSLGKTLLTVAVGAACIAFPAVGLVACGVGAVSGAVTLGKGIINAATAETDAQAKDAWENIGDGALTTISSVFGAKASFKAMKATSTAGLSSVDDVANAAKKLGASDDIANSLKSIDNVDDALKAANNAGFKIDASKFGNLAEDATKLDKLKAIGSDMKSSTLNQGKVVWAKAGELTQSAKTTKDAAAYNKNLEEKSLLEAKKMETTLSTEEQARLDKLNELTNVDDAIKTRAQNLTDKSNLKESLAQDIADKKQALKDAKKAGVKEDIQAAKEAYQTAKKQNSTFGQLTNKVKTTTDSIKDTEAAQALSEAKGTLTQGLNKKSLLHPIETFNTIKDNAKAVDVANIGSKLSTTGRAILTKLTDGTTSYAQLVQEYGYSNVAQVLQVAQGYMFAKESV